LNRKQRRQAEQQRRPQKTGSSQSQAWAREVQAVSAIVRARLVMRRKAEPDPEEVRRLANGILLLCTADEDGFAVAEFFMALEREKREKDGEIDAPPAEWRRERGESDSLVVELETAEVAPEPPKTTAVSGRRVKVQPAEDFPHGASEPGLVPLLGAIGEVVGPSTASATGLLVRIDGIIFDIDVRYLATVSM
jgi:hypothetical protein